jgi:nucleoside-diphosphate-sugar epimerase
MDVLITGIRGFVGSNLGPALGGHRVYGLSSGRNLRSGGGAGAWYGWEELGHLPRLDAVIHLAGKAHDLGGRGDTRGRGDTKNRVAAGEYFEINTGLTRAIFDWYVGSGAKKFIYFSSVKAAAETVGGVLTEDTPARPRGPYGESKRAAEEYIEKRAGKGVYILRPAMIHGPGNRGNLNLLYRAVKTGLPWPLGAFDNRRSFASIGNVNYIVRRLLEDDIEPGLYNIADDEALSTNGVVEILCEVLSRKRRIWRVNRRLVESAAALGSVLGLPLNRERLGKLTENYVVSNEKIKAALGVSGLPISAREGFVTTFRSFEGRGA